MRLSFSRSVCCLVCVRVCLCVCVLFLFASQAYSKAKAAGKELEVVYVPVADSAEVRNNQVNATFYSFYMANM